MHTPSRLFHALSLSAFLAGFLTACASNLVPMRPLIRTTTWVPDAATTAPSTQTADTHPTTTTAPTAPTTQPQLPITNYQLPTTTTVPSTQSADSPPSTAPTTRLASTKPAATQPGHNVTTVTDPNETARYIYKADYDNLWRQSMATLTKAGFLFDRLDYRLGVITTKPLPSAQFIEFWKSQHTTLKNSLENTINNQRRIVRITIAPVPGKPDFYRIAIQVAVERQTNPNEDLGGTIFVEGSAFGRTQLAVRSDYASPTKFGDPALWILIGRDPLLEHKLLSALFNRI
jgi:hypothetical protein